MTQDYDFIITFQNYKGYLLGCLYDAKVTVRNAKAFPFTYPPLVPASNYDTVALMGGWNYELPGEWSGREYLEIIGVEERKSEIQRIHEELGLTMISERIGIGYCKMHSGKLEGDWFNRKALVCRRNMEFFVDLSRRCWKMLQPGEGAICIEEMYDDFPALDGAGVFIEGDRDPKVSA